MNTKCIGLTGRHNWTTLLVGGQPRHRCGWCGELPPTQPQKEMEK